MTLRRVNDRELRNLAVFLDMSADRKRIARRLRELRVPDLRHLARLDPGWAARVEELRRQLKTYPGRADRGGRPIVYAILSKYPDAPGPVIRDFLASRGLYYSPGAIRRMKHEYRRSM